MFDIKFFDELDSTMDTIKQYPNNTAVIAERQRKGRGKGNRVWITSEKNDNLYMSVKIKDIGDQSFNYVFVTSLLILKTLHLFFNDINIQLKWPNDILLNNKKIAGILIERDILNENIIIGISLNIDFFPENVIYTATSLKNEGFVLDKYAFINKFLELFKQYNLSDFPKTIQEWLKYAYNFKKQINVKINEEVIVGVFENLRDDGCLVLDCEDKIKNIFVGDVF